MRLEWEPQKRWTRVGMGLVPRQTYMILGGPETVGFVYGMFDASQLSGSVIEGVFSPGTCFVGLDDGLRWKVVTDGMEGSWPFTALQVDAFDSPLLERRRTHALTVLVPAIAERVQMKRRRQHHAKGHVEDMPEWYAQARLHWKENRGIPAF